MVVPCRESCVVHCSLQQNPNSQANALTQSQRLGSSLLEWRRFLDIDVQKTVTRGLNV